MREIYAEAVADGFSTVMLPELPRAVAKANDIDQPPPIPRFISLPFGAEHALGGWAGARTWLERNDIDIGLNYFAEPGAIVAGGRRQGVDYTSQIWLSVDLDGQKLLGLTGFALHAAIVQLNGRSSSADFLTASLSGFTPALSRRRERLLSRIFFETGNILS